MRSELTSVLLQHSRWMTWNALLALIPFGLARVLFSRPRSRTPWWWLGVTVFVLFLPNAPYVLTDVIHLFEDVRKVHSDQAVLFVLVPVYAALFTVGFGAYVLSVREVVHWLRRGRVRDYRMAMVVLGAHAMAAIGVDLGRFQRFNSWDAVLRPGTLVTGFGRALGHPLRITVTFFVIAALYSATHVLVLGLRTWWRQVNGGQRPSAA